MTNEQIWNNNTPISDINGLDLNVPEWIEFDITPYDVAAIVQGGCDSGAYMPAVNYYHANKVMSEHGDDVLWYIEQYADELPTPPKGSSWSRMAVFYLSYAVELWAAGAHYELELFDSEAA
jgi:hypothetical protein